MKNLIPWKKRDHDIANMRKDFDDFFDRFFSEPVFSLPKLSSEGSWYPNVDVSEGKRNIIVKAEIPGVDKEGIDLSLDGRLLTICGEKKQEKEESDEHYHRVESSYGFYKRTIELPADIDESKVDAKYKTWELQLDPKQLEIPPDGAEENELQYQRLWRKYYQAVNICARNNSRLHVRQLPRRCRRHLPEKQPAGS